MKKILLLILAAFSINTLIAQATMYDTRKIRVRDTLMVGDKKITIITDDTTNTGLDNFTLFTAAAAKKLGSTGGRFTNNVVVNGGAGTKVGVWSEGETIPLAGKLYDSLIYILATKCIAPTYTPPTAAISVSSGANFGTYEYGYNIGTVTLNSGFTQNDAGTLSSTEYYGSTANPPTTLLGSNSFTIGTLTDKYYARARKYYAQGNCKTNNCGETDCTGRINASNVYSSVGTWDVGYRRYMGWISDTTGIASGSQNSAILANVIGSGFSTSQVFGSSGSPIATGTPSGTNFWVFAYLSSSPGITAITQNGIPSLDSYKSAVISGFTNNQGASVSIRVYWTAQGQTSSSSIYTQ